MKYTSQHQSKKERKKYTQKIVTLSSIKLSSLTHSKIDSKDVFSNNNQIAKHIVFFKKISFDVFFSNTYKYPLLIREDLNLLKNADKNITRYNSFPSWKNELSILLKNQYTIEVGDEKVGLFKKEKRIYVRNENPHTSTDDLKFFILEDDRKWYQKDAWKIIGTAVVTTFILRNI